jgi:hypothetical protein
MEYFFHGTGEDCSALEIMIDIIESGGIKSKNKRNEHYFTLFNGDDYVSVTRWVYDNPSHLSADMDSSFYGWIFNMPCFIIASDIDAIHAKKIRVGEAYDYNKDRVSVFIDEWHVKDEIPLDKIVGVALPFSWLRKSKEVLVNILQILKYAKQYNWQVYDSNMNLIEKVESEEAVFGPDKLEKKYNI